MIPIIHNVVATIQIECDMLDIACLHKLLPFSSYDKRKFAAATIRLHNPQCTCLLFTSGKLVVTGANSCDEALLTAYCIRDILKDIYPYTKFEIKAFDVQNMVAHVELPMKQEQSLMLSDLYNEHASECTYQRKMFPGLIFRPKDTHIVFLCFSSGKIVITGATRESEILETWERIAPLIKSYVVTVGSTVSN